MIRKLRLTEVKMLGASGGAEAGTTDSKVRHIRDAASPSTREAPGPEVRIWEGMFSLYSQHF
jgi:hypothetical protein